MSWGIDEDRYWENAREYAENYQYYEPEHEKDYLFLDEEQESIESTRGPMDRMTERELLEIVEEFLGVEAESAKWVPGMYGIEYEYVA